MTTTTPPTTTTAKQYFTGHAATVNAAIRRAIAAGQTVYARTWHGGHLVSGVQRVKNRGSQMYARWTFTDPDGIARTTEDFEPVAAVWTLVDASSPGAVVPPGSPEAEQARHVFRAQAAAQAVQQGHRLGRWERDGATLASRCTICGRTAIVNHRRIIIDHTALQRGTAVDTLCGAPAD